jgi:hypothetical protein
MEGQTCCICHDKEYILNPGDLIVIPASAPHSCNPVAGQPRSYHMLYIDTDIPLALQVIRDPALFKRYLDIVETMSPVSVDTLLSALPRRGKRRRASLNQPARAGVSCRPGRTAFA